MPDDSSPSDGLSSAGASAQAEYYRRVAAHRASVAESRPRLLAIVGVGVVAALVAGLRMPAVGFAVLMVVLVLTAGAVFVPNATAAWGIGAEGERRTGGALDQLKSEGFVILHDRSIPGSWTNIDHIVIGPPGVAVVETKSYRGKLRVRGGEVYVNGYRRTDTTVGEVVGEAAAVSRVLRGAPERRGVIIRPILCIHRADLPFFAASPRGVPIVDGRGLVQMLRKAPPQLSPDDIKLLARLLDDRLRPASARLLDIDHSTEVEASPAGAGTRGGQSSVDYVGDERYLPPARREQLRRAREARARATHERSYWTRDGLAAGKAAPTVPPAQPDKQR